MVDKELEYRPRELMRDKELTLVEHLNELRSRTIKSVVFIIACSAALYNYINIILPILTKPAGKLVFIAPQEAFIANIKIAFFAGIFVSSPYVLYQIWQFVSVGLNPKERKYTLIFGPLSFIFFISGCAFSFFIILPLGMKFLLGFASDFVSPMITVDKYISFAGTLILAFGTVFQLPLITVFLTKVGLVTPKFLSRKRKHVIVLIFIAAAILTPPDVVTQCLMALPLLVLYELGVALSAFVYRAV
jgi:sec-independent protein translocase protein TatC